MRLTRGFLHHQFIEPRQRGLQSDAGRPAALARFVVGAKRPKREKVKISSAPKVKNNYSCTQESVSIEKISSHEENTVHH
jgi:hypothetical protein